MVQVTGPKADKLLMRLMAALIAISKSTTTKTREYLASAHAFAKPHAFSTVSRSADAIQRTLAQPKPVTAWIVAAAATIAMPYAVEAKTLTTIPTLEKRCRAQKESGACYELSSIWMNSGIPSNKQRGIMFAQEGCVIDKKRECSADESIAIGNYYLKAKNEIDKLKDRAVASAPETKGDRYAGDRDQNKLECEKGDAKGCQKLSTYYMYFAPVSNPEKAKEYSKRACDLGDEGGCGALSLMKSGVIKVYDVETE